MLVEEVVDSVFSGMRHVAISSSSTTTTSTLSPSSMPGVYAYKRDLVVVLRFEGHEQWKITSTTGAWRRIVMNILGNALKYTDKGFIEISVSLLKPPGDPESAIAHFSFVDSGCGMSEDFLRNKLFSPFTQEDPLSEGAGLGLSIVKQLVSFLDGSIDMKSELGVGTQVDVFIPVQPAQASGNLSAITIPGTAADKELPNTTFSLVGFGSCPGLFEEPTGRLNLSTKRKICLQSFFSNIIETQPSWSVSQVESLEHADGDIVIIEESALKQLYDDEFLRRRAAAERMRLVCLRHGLPSVNSKGLVEGEQVVHLYQP